MSKDVLTCMYVQRSKSPDKGACGLCRGQQNWHVGWWYKAVLAVDGCWYCHIVQVELTD